MAEFERVAVLGLGLLGGSVALATQRAGVAAQVVGATRNPEVLKEALNRGVIDEACSFEGAVRGADLVVLAPTLAAMASVVQRVAQCLREDAIVSDVGSVKGVLAEALPKALPSGVRYVGAHPMAGSHEVGLAHARADLFDGAPCVVMNDADPAAADRICEFWRALGALVVRRDPAAHDEDVAWMSHLPHVLAWAFAEALRGAPERSREVAGSGFRDFTRIARSSPQLWGDILSANQKAIGGPLREVAKALADFADAIEAGDALEVERLIARARENLTQERQR